MRDDRVQRVLTEVPARAYPPSEPKGRFVGITHSCIDLAAFEKPFRVICEWV